MTSHPRPSILSPERWLRFRPSSGVYVAEIDGLRFVAIMAVIAVHIAGIWLINVGRAYPDMNAAEALLRDLLMLGGYGVELFFVISGFVLALPFLKHARGEGRAVPLGTYLLRRLTRLEPPYVLSMLLFFAIYPFIGKGSYSELWPHLGASLLYVHNVVFGAGSVLNNNAWSLEIEVQFYLLVPLLFALLRRSAVARQAVVAGFVLASSLHFLWLPAGFPKTLLQYAQFFGVGLLLAERWLSGWRQAVRSHYWDGIGLGAVVLFFALNLSPCKNIASLLNPWLTGAFAAAALRGVRLGRLLSWGWIPAIGGMCYSIYLLHARLVSLVLHHGMGRFELSGHFGIDIILLSLAAVPVTLAGSALFYLLVERPCMNPAWPSLLRQRWQKRWTKPEKLGQPES